jgi:putative chitinase
MDEKKSIFDSIKSMFTSRKTLGMSDESSQEPAQQEAAAESKDNIQNIDFDVVKQSFTNIETSLDKLSEIFEGINKTLESLVVQQDREKYTEEEAALENREMAPPGEEPVAEREEAPSFFDSLKSLFMNPAVIAALAGIVYTVLPKEVQEKIKGVLGGFANGLNESTDGFSELSATTKLVGVGLLTYFGAKFLSSIANAASTVLSMIRGFGRMGKFGKLAVVGTAAVVGGKMLFGDDSSKEEQPEIEKEEETKDLESKTVEKTETEKETTESTSTAQASTTATTSSTTSSTTSETATETTKVEEKPAPTSTDMKQAEPAKPPSRQERIQMATAAPSATPAASSGTSTPSAPPATESKPTVAAAPASAQLPGKSATGDKKAAPVKAESPKRGPGFQAGVSAMKQAIQKEGITNPEAVAQILAQTAHESGGFKYTEELASGQNYEGRKDLGNNEPGDGVRYKGRGFLQVTGKSNYAAISKDLGVDFVKNPSMLADPKYAAESALWFFKRPYNARRIKDWGDTKAVTKVVNGGYNGLAEREQYFAQFSSDPSITQASAAELTPQQQAQKVLAPSQTPMPESTPRASAGAQVASLSTKNEALATPAPQAPQVFNNSKVNNTSGKMQPTESNDAPQIPIPIASRGSLTADVHHATHYA